MAKITAHYQKKQSDQSYGSQMVGASIEVEVEGDSPEGVKASLRRLFELAKQAVNEQLAAVGQPQQASRPAASGQSVAPKPGGNGNGGHRIPSTQAQRKAIYAIAKSKGLDPAQFNADSLSVKEASSLIDQLKSQQAGSR
ncbi:MAG: hypothetical protein NTW87_07300 [Planctomycetota bacterium]|nr:hypothetical protein [Planctomycetota bacterium]